MENKRPVGCTCSFDTEGNPLLGGYARCPIHDPNTFRIPIEGTPFPTIAGPELYQDFEFKPKFNIEAIAKVAHEVNKAFCQAIGDTSQPTWEDAPEWQKSSAINGVKFHLENPDATPENSHQSWLKQKEEEGWKYGPVKNPETKEHPCFVPYSELPTEQKAKDYLFRQIIHSLKPYLT